MNKYIRKQLKKAFDDEKKREKAKAKELRAEVKGVACQRKRVEKYGAPILTALASHDKALVSIYDLFLDEKKSAHRDRVMSLIYLMISAPFMIVGLVINEIILTSVGGIFLCFAMCLSNSARITEVNCHNIGKDIVEVASNEAKKKVVKEMFDEKLKS